RVEKLVPPAELAVPGALEAQLVEVELDLAVEVVLVLRHALDDIESPLGQRGARRCPRDAAPAGIHVADELEVRPLRPPATTRQPEVAGFSLEVQRIDQAQLLRLAVELPDEVLGLPVEERAVVLAHVGTEKAVRTVG